MGCKIFRNNKGKISKVEAPNGKESILYKSILDNLPDSIEIDSYVKEAYQRNQIKSLERDEIALALWSKVYTPTFKRNNKNVELDINKEPVFKEELNLISKGEFLLSNSIKNIKRDKIKQSAIELEQNLTNLLTSLGVNINLVNKIKDSKGNILDAYGKADLLSQTIELTKDRDITTLPEEAAHMITALMGMDNPIIKQMMSNIDQFPLYKSVLNEYNGIYETEEEFRFEAVGKLIAVHLIKGVNIGNSEAKSFTNNWFKRLINKLSQKLFGKNITPLKESLNLYEQTARKILNNDIADVVKPEIKANKKLAEISQRYNMNNSGFMPAQIIKEQLQSELRKNGFSTISVATASNGSYYLKRNGKKINPVIEAFQIKKTQSEIVNQLVNDRKKVSINKKLDEKGRERYVVDGKIVANRVTDLQTELFTRGKTKEDLEKIENSPKSIVARDLGTKLHDINETLLNHAVGLKDNLQLPPGSQQEGLPELPSYLKASHLVEMGKSINYLADEIDIQQRKIDPDSKATVITENFVIDNKKDTAGSQDVLVIYSDGSVSVYDYKFINFKKEKIDGRFQVAPDTSIPFVKEKSYNLQISEYKRILKDIYGVTRFRATRILPFNIQYGYDNKNKKPISKVAELEGFKINSEKDYLIPLPVAGELTDNEKMNKILSRLFKKEEDLVKRIKDNWSNSNITNALKLELGSIKKSKQHIQVLSDITPLIDSINITLDNIASGVGEITIDTIDDLNKMIAEIKLFDQIYKEAREFIDKESNHDLEVISRRLADAEIVLNGKLIELLSEYNPDINTPQRELDYFQRNLGYFSKINHPIFETAWDLIKKSTGDTNRDVLAFTENIEEKVNNLKDWAKSRNISLLEAYRKITNSKTGNLIGMFSQDFYKTKSKKNEDGNVKWFKDNYKETEQGKEKYKENLAQYEKSLKNVGEKYRKFRLESWKNQNDLSRDSAWLNSYAINNYTELKNPEKYYSKEYKELLNPSNKVLKEYFDFYREANFMFNQLVDERIDGNFVANIQKDLVDSLSQGGGLIKSIKNAKDDFLNGMRVRQNDSYLSIGETDNKIPLLYYDNFMYKDKDGNWKNDTVKKNEDLTNNIILFAESVYRKHNMSKIQGTIESLKLHINNQNVIVTDNRSKPKVNKFTGELETGESSKNAEVFEALTKALVYGKRIQNKDTHVAVGDNVFSTNKIVSNMMSYMSTKSLAFNYISGFGNLAAGYANTYIKSVGGRYYNGKQMWKTHKLLMSRGNKDLYNHLSEYFNVERDHWVQEKAAKLSTSALTRNLTADKWYILQQKGDEFIANTILISMMQNYGLDSNNRVKRLALLPEGTKSLFEKVERKNDKISIEGLSNEAFDEFRNMVRYVSRQVKGTNTSEDISMIQTTIWGKSIMHFRNWIAPMVDERFGKLKYTKDVKEFEYGRYKSLWSSIINKRFLPNFKKLLVDVATFGIVKYKGDSSLFQQQYEKFIQENPDIKDNISFEEYVNLRERTIRESVHELKILTGLMLLMLAARGDWDDDGVEDYKQTKLTRELYKLLNRSYLELSFFTNPTSVRDLLKSPVPIMQVGVDVINVFNNTTDEVLDLIFQPEEKDKTPIGHYSKKLIPVAKHVFDFFEDFNEE